MSGNDNLRYSRKADEAFTLVELLVVMSIITVIASLSIPALYRAKVRSKSTICQNNLRQLNMAWTLYSGDSQERLAPNVPSDIAGSTAEFASWVAGYLGYASNNAANTNILDLIGDRFGSIGKYASVPGIYKCPSDPSRAVCGGAKFPRIRSYSMNAFLGDSPVNLTQDSVYMRFISFADLARTSASETWVLIDEHPDSLDDGYFWIPMIPNGFTTWQAVPGSTHAGGANISFVDGHVASRNWNDPRTQVLVLGKHLNPISCAGNSDVAWLQSQTSILK